MNRKILFIINPVAGVKNKESLPDLIHGTMKGSPHSYDIRFTERRLHGLELAQEAVKEGFQEVIAAGGDGTINEIASGLVETSTALGIIPMGSGNGLARHLGIPLEINNALEVISKGNKKAIDTGKINDRTFLCTAGVGFEAHVSYIFDQVDGRGFKTYVKSVVKELGGYKAKSYVIESNGQKETLEAFTICFANASQYGNNVYICPEADISDGQLNLCTIAPFPKIAYPGIVRRLFQKSINNSKFYAQKPITHVKVSLSEKEQAHVDGDPIDLGQELEIRILPNSLEMIIP